MGTREREREREREMGGMGEVCLSSGMRMPLVGMGTATFPFSPSVEMKEAILHAMELGYRHFDAAAVYNSEQILGEAIEEAMGRGIIHTRQQLFITSKLWCTDAHGHLVLPALHKSLQLSYYPRAQVFKGKKMAVMFLHITYSVGSS
eukprot:TRINITY_DN33575_c0_g1_i2.p1 TRINITY_DN33575_c0_g1~~TRINITY_DN33575_c0_g1_i2.p1  ORF type:complete len:147 (-),score=27.53 TRINITY_DN33575_c0_g1_i2:156-596(-)